MSFRASIVQPAGEAPSRTDVPPPWAPWLLIGIGLVVLQSALPWPFGPRTLRFSAAGLVVLWFGFTGGPLRGAIFGATIGLVEDALGASAAAWTCADAIAGAAAGLLPRTVAGETIVYTSAAAALLSFVRLGIFALFVRVENSPAASASASLAHLALGALASGAAAALALAIGRRFGDARGGA